MEEIKIQGEAGTDPEVCKFTVDRPVYPGGSAYFGSRAMADLSPLALKLFEVRGVETVLIADNQITISKSSHDPWPVAGKQIGAKIREHINSGEPAVTEEFRRKLPSENELRKRVQQVLDQEINPAVAMHGGYIDLIDVKSNSVYIQLQGGCQGCGAAPITLKQGIEKSIRREVPEVGEILDTTDHASGRNPYYQPSK